jgi:hypothetical protein
MACLFARPPNEIRNLGYLSFPHASLGRPLILSPRRAAWAVPHSIQHKMEISLRLEFSTPNCHGTQFFAFVFFRKKLTFGPRRKYSRFWTLFSVSWVAVGHTAHGAEVLTLLACVNHRGVTGSNTNGYQ